MSSNSIRVSVELFEQARLQGDVMSRSAAQQIEHWAKLGAALEARGLSVAQMSRLLQAQRQADPMEVEVAPADDLWAFKRSRQARDLERVESGASSNDRMSWFSAGRAKSARLVGSPF
ncbi:MAG TPA: hypothetical protein VF169_23970 [Albitalea sp.]|uniref:TA system antitoxin ParD family protein n=1 Tax=Piscinibacter sp. TaxID=1903157 RepID=UPI002ED2A356